MGNKQAKSKCEKPKTGKSVSTTDNTVILFSHPPPHLPSRPPPHLPPRPPPRPSSCPPNPPKRPTQFMTVEEFFKNWHIWKNQFLLYKTRTTQIDNEQQWGNTLLNLMGPIGQNIYSTFTFESSNEIRNVDVLLEKFDEYSVFSTKKKLPLENVYEYINDLQVIVRDKNIHVDENADEMIRKKIFKEIDKYQFTNAAKRMIPTFIFSSDFNKLTMKEIAFIWELYIDNICKRCGNNHGTQKCPALGKQCQKCNEWNHYQRMCPKYLINNCKFCGGSHEHRKCPAFNEICTKCQKQNHFSWRCQRNQILNCHFCGTKHGASRSLCPGNNIICSNCSKKGHIASKCKQASRLHRS